MNQRKSSPTSEQEKNWDVIVIGTGMGGATIGYALAKAGKKVLFCEKGENNFKNSRGLRGDYAENFFSPPKSPSLEHADLLSRAGRWKEEIVDISTQKKRSHIPFLGEGAGGSSALYGMVMERFFPSDFSPGKVFHDLPSQILVPENWPISYNELAPFYEKAEKLYRVRGEHDPLRGKEITGYISPLPPLSKSSKELFDFFSNKKLHPYRLPMACEYNDGCKCCQGYLCDQECKNDSFQICLKPALAEYNAQLLEQCEVVHIDASETEVTGVVCLYQKKLTTFHAPLVILAAGALNTPRILLNSTSNVWPDGLANSSGLVGKFLMRHYVDLYAVKTKTVEQEKKSFKEIAFNDFYLYDGKKLGTIQSFGSLPPASILVEGLEKEVKENQALWGTLFKFAKPLVKKFLAKTFSRRVIMATVMEDLPSRDNFISLGRKRDSYGRRNLIMNYTISAYEKNRIETFRQEMRGILNPYRFLCIKQAENNERIAHICGTCRFGADPKSSVLDRNNKTHGLSNLYVVDSSFFPTSAGTNPALTVAANALRIANHLTNQI